MASTYLTRTSTAGNRKTLTFSAWIKRADISSNQGLAVGYDNSNNYTLIRLEGGALHVFTLNGGSFQFQLKTNRLLRDTSAWYHIVVAIDTSQATSTDRVKLYINGTQETSLAVSSYPSQNDFTFFNSTFNVSVGYNGSGDYFDGEMAHVHFIDGIAYAASTFGETDSTTGIWKPKTAPSVTYGTNGFFLKFENSGAFGTDSSGNANNFTVNGTMTQTIDTPSNVFCTWNPLDNYYAGSTFSDGNTTIDTGTSGYAANTSTLGMSSGKYYCEIKAVNIFNGYAQFGIKGRVATATNDKGGTGTDGYIYTASGGNKVNNNTATSYGTVWNNNDIIGIAVDLDNNYLYFSRNGTWQNSGDPTSGASGTGAAFSLIAPSSGAYYFCTSDNDSGATNEYQANFGNGYFGTTAVSSAQNPDDGIGIFEYDVPAGYRALCTKSINAEEYS